ncbi:hypothetical protein MUO66_07925 [Candidatus Bathyarchaeota archaeon]|nr:hypothetical protein [Candidatus Bathyarchaeota archaeon]
MKKSFVVFFLIFLGMMTAILAESATQKKNLDFELLFNFESLSPKIQFVPVSNNFFFVDDSGTIYFCDFSNHRIAKYSSAGDFLGQIGRIGQGKDDLYFPVGVYLFQKRIYVLNNVGKEIKAFNQEGKCIDGFEIKKSASTYSFFVTKDFIVTDTKYSDHKNYNRQKLITLFDHSGKKIRSFGDVVKCKTFLGHKEFNALHLGFDNNNIFGAFSNSPIIFKYSMKGKKIIRQNISELAITEIQGLIDRTISEKMDTPLSIKESNKLRFVGFSPGICIYGTELLYSVNSKASLLVFDTNGNLVENIGLIFRDNPIWLDRLFINKNNNLIYGIGILDKGKKKVFLKINLINNPNERG